MKTELISNGSSNTTFKKVASIKDINSMFNAMDKGKGDPCDLFNFAAKNGFIEPIKNPLSPPVDPFIVNVPLFNVPDPSAVKLLNLMQGTPRPIFNIDWDTLERTPELIQYQDSSNTVRWGTTQDPSAMAYEIGKFQTGKNEVGVIKSIQTAINFHDTDLRTPRADPYWHTRTFAPQVGGAVCKWFLRIERLNPAGVNIQDFRQATTAGGSEDTAIPGQAFEELPSWETMRFLWGADHPLFLICPQNSLVSLWINFPYTGNPKGLRDTVGLLKGYTQPEASPRTYENLTKTW